MKKTGASIFLALFGLVLPTVTIHAATLTAGYVIGGNLIATNDSTVFVDNAALGGGDATFLNGVSVWSAELTGLWNKGESVAITGIALPIHSSGASSTTLNGTFTFNFYELNKGTNENQFEGTATETLVGSATATFNGYGTTGTSVYYVDFDTPITFTAASTGVAVHITNSAALRLKVNSSGSLRRSNSDGAPSGGDNPYFKMSLAGRVVPAMQDFQWFSGTTIGDHASLFDEQNWLYRDGSGVPPAGSIDPNIEINRNLLIGTGTPGGSSGASGILRLGSGTLSVSHATLRMSATNNSGIDMGGTHQQLTITSGKVFAEFIDSGIVTLIGKSELTLYSLTNPLPNGTTVDLQGGSDCFVYFANIIPSDVNSSWLSRLTVNGAPASGLVSVREYYNGSVVMLNPAAPVIAFAQTNGQGQSWNYAAGFWGKLADGTVGVTNGVYTVGGMGETINSGDDEFTFVYRALNGNGELIARINSFAVTAGREAQAKAGVMLRESLDSLSRYSYLQADSALSVQSQVRGNTNNNPSTSADTGTTNVAKWLRLVRSGNNVSTYYSETGTNGPWTQIGTTATWASAGTLYIGLAVNSFSAVPTTAVFDGLSLIQDGVPVGSGDYGAFTDLADVRKAFPAGTQMSSFLLKKGYEAVLSHDVGGMGYSKVYIATESDLLINLPSQLDKHVSFMNVVPWRWIAKKGWDGSMANAKTMGAFWDYQWEPTGNSTANIEFVPMIKGRAQNKDYRWDEIRTRGGQTHFLGFNEPMSANQGDLTVDEAIALWPKAQAIGLRLGSPSRTDGSNGDDWLQEFMQKANANGYRVDYICVHNYHQTTAADLKSWLQAEHNKYGLPIWLTEFNRTDADTTATTAQMKNYLNDVLPMLESLPYVERYAMFNFPSNPLFDADGNPTSLGQIYLNTKSNPAYTNSANLPIGTVMLTTPINNSIVTNNVPLSLSASITPPSSAITKVDFFVNDILAGTGTVAPYIITATNLVNGINNIYATATTAFGETVTSPSVQITMVPPLLPTAPTNIICAVSNNNVMISWPGEYTGWLLQAQTNNLGTNWTTIVGSVSTNSMSIPIDPANAAVFFRLMRP